MIRLAAIAVLCSTIGPVVAQDQYVPFDYSKSFQRPAEHQHEPAPEPEPTPAKQLQQPAPEPAPVEQPPLTQPEPAPEPQQQQPDTSILDLDDLRKMIDEQIDERVQPYKPVPDPEPPARREPLVTLHTQGRTQVMALTTCGWTERDKFGRFNSACQPCNAGNTVFDRFGERWRGHYSVGTSESDDIRIVDITTREGRDIDLAMGQGGYSLTELLAKSNPDINQYTPATPVFVVRYPDKEPRIVANYPPDLDPNSEEALWWVLDLLGVERSNPRTWQGIPNADFHAISLWVQSGPNARPTHAGGWGATISARDVIAMLAPGGRKQIVGNTYLVVPDTFRPRLVNTGGRHRIQWTGHPFIEYQIGFLTRKAILTHVEISEDLSKFTLHASGYRTTFPISIDWEN